MGSGATETGASAAEATTSSAVTAASSATAAIDSVASSGDRGGHTLDLRQHGIARKATGTGGLLFCVLCLSDTCSCQCCCPVRLKLIGTHADPSLEQR